MTRIAVGMLLLLASAACSDSTGPDGSVPGGYTLTQLTYVQLGHTRDAIEEGTVMHVTLTGDGTTTGSLHTPAASSESGSDEDVSLAGTWAFDADSTHISFNFPAAPGFLLAANPWAIVGSTLAFTYSSGDEFVVTATLTRN
jgi:hypothetical protein